MHIQTPERLAATNLGQWLAQRHWQIATAESCTGGGIGYAISAIAGSSAWFAGGVISYSNAIKENILQVDPAILAEHGAVSAACAEAMAIGARQLCQVDMAVAVTGVAGPAGGTADKPVGLVWFGLATADAVLSWQQQFTGDRDEVRLKTIQEALLSYQKI